MKFQVEALSAVKRRIRVEVPAERVAEEFASAYSSFARRARIKGFRPGKVPRTVLEGYYGIELKSEVFKRLVSGALAEAIRDAALPVVSRPQVETSEELADGRSFSFSACVEVEPDIVLKDYRGIELEKIRLEVGPEEVEKALARLQEQHARLEPVDESHEAIARGDFAVIDFRGSIGGRELPGARGENYLVEVGAGRVLPEMEQALIGLGKGSERTVAVTYPEDFSNPDLAGRAAQFTIRVREIKKKVMPPLDDDFAREYGGCPTLEELREKIRSRLQEELEEFQQRLLRQRLLDRLVEMHAFEAPPALVEEEMRALDERHARPALSVHEAGASEPEAERRHLEERAARQVRARLLLERIAAAEKISVSDEELDSRIERMVRSAKEQAAALRKYYASPAARDALRSRLVRERALDLVLSQARIREVESPAPVAEG
jgi:trigger factor